MHHNYSTSPIKVLEGAGEGWRRQHPYQDEFFEVRSRRLEAELAQIKDENLLLRRRLLDTDSNILLLEENSRLKAEVDILNSEVQRLVMALQATDSLELLLREKTGEVETLKAKLLAFDIETGSEINRLEAQRYLQRSRTSIIAETSCDTSSFVDKQLKKLTEELRGKNEEISDLNRRHLAENRRADQLVRQHSDHLESLAEEKKKELKAVIEGWERKNQQSQETIARLEGELRDLQLKDADLIKDLATVSAEKKLLEDSLKTKDIEIQGLKHIIEQQTSQHLKEYSQLAASRKRSSKNLGSQRSFAQEAPPTPVLAAVSENIGEFSRLDAEDTERLERAYRLKLEEQERSSEMRISSLEEEVQRLENALMKKQEETADILTRFIPLLRLQTGEMTLEQDRKDRIQRHWKADLSILEVLLRQYKIKILE